MTLLTADFSKLKVVGLTRDMAESYAPTNITVSYAGQDGTPEPFLMIINGSRSGSIGRLRRKIFLPVLPTPGVAEIGLSRNDSDAFVLSAAQAATIAGVDGKTAGQLVEGAHTICPESNTMRGNVNVQIAPRLGELRRRNSPDRCGKSYPRNWPESRWEERPYVIDFYFHA
jgi:hypothetical protein